jgi:hypothetical protein
MVEAEVSGSYLGPSSAEQAQTEGLCRQERRSWVICEILNVGEGKRKGSRMTPKTLS